MKEFQRYRDITRQYPELQGLRLVPFGLFLLFLGLQRLGLPYLGQQGDLTFTLPFLAFVIFLWFIIGRYYESTFGKVEPLSKRKAQLRLERFWFIGLVLCIVLENGLFRAGIDLRFSLIEDFIGLSFLWIGVKTHRWYYDLAGILTLIMSILPLVTRTGLGNQWFGSFGIVFSTGFGILYCLIGLLDHFRLVSSLHGWNGDADGRIE
jgi:hypothetical protein